MSGNVGSCCQMEVGEADEEDVEEERHFSSQDLVKIRDAVVVLVQSLLRLLQTFPLKDMPQSASNLTQVINTSTTTQLHATRGGELFVLSLQIFSKLLYFEPAVGELAFAAVQ